MRDRAVIGEHPMHSKIASMLFDDDSDDFEEDLDEMLEE